MCFDPKIYEIVYRTEGVWPTRHSYRTIEYFRTLDPHNNIFGGLVFEQGETWSKLRHIVGPMMLKPDSVKSYVLSVDEVTRDFMLKVRSMLDANRETPVDFAKEMSLWAVESIGIVGLDRRLGVLQPNCSPEAQLLIKVNSCKLQ